MTAATTPASLDFTLAGGERRLSFTPSHLVIAGYTGRDRAAVQAHIDELAAIGVPPPPRVPMFYELPATLATTDPSVAVSGAQTSGEVEPVILQHQGVLYLTLGSDHTDRELEQVDVARSKAAAPKPVGATLVPLAGLADSWDAITLRCSVDGQLYQEGSLAGLTPPDALLAQYRSSGGELGDGALMFCGTMPILAGAFVFGRHWELELRLTDGTVMTHSYQTTISGSGRDGQAGA